MSATDTVVDAALFEYVTERAGGDDLFLLDLKEAAEDAGLPPIWISRAQAAFMQVLLGIAGSRDVLEVGTLAGYAAIKMARALPEGGRVRTVEVNPDHAAFARDWIGRSDVAGRVEVIEGAGADVLPGIAAGSMDAVFLDADRQTYPVYLEEVWRILRPGGILMVDNAFAHGEVVVPVPEDPTAAPMRSFNDLLAGDERFSGIIVPIGDGLWVARRI